MFVSAQLTVPQVLTRGGTIVVPGDPAAQSLRTLHDANQQANGWKAWSPANVLTWDQWLRSLWSNAITNGTEDRLLLNAAQAHSLWLDVVSKGKTASDALTSPDALAELAAKAWRLSESYGATDRLGRFASTHDARTFADWAENFVRLCKTNGYVSRASLERMLLSKFATGELRSLEPLTFSGFSARTPAQASLLETLGKTGTEITEAQVVADTASETERFVLKADSGTEELLAIAQWIRGFVKTRTAEGLSARVGVLVPDLDSMHDTVSRIFCNILSPELQSVSTQDANTPFEMSPFSNLRSEPMVAAALDVLHWVIRPLNREAVSALLLSRYLTPESGLRAAAQFDAGTLRSARLLRPEVDLHWLAKELWRGNSSSAVSWPQALAKFLDVADELATARTFAQWTEFMRRMLRTAGWPGEQPLSPHEDATSRAWEHALDSVATLDFSGARTTFSEALQALVRQVAKTPSHKPSGLALIQILQPSDADGMNFDALVIARATDSNWPRTPGPNPLIGWQLQTQLGMPGTNRETAGVEARAAIAQWMRAANTVIFSFAANDGDSPQRLSPYIADLQLGQKSASDLLLASATEEHVDAEVFEDTTPLPPLPSSHVHGGATILQYQAACGFRAFAEIRLRAQELEARDLGYDARERGNLLHSVMQRFWTEVKTQRALREKSPEERRALLSQCIDEYLDKNPSSTHGWDAAYLLLQKQRLTRLLTYWLNSELQRSEFVVLETEIKEEISIGPLDLTVRLDRIDSVDGDGVVLIDYKTGSAASAADWEGERPDEPQLPLYSLLPDAAELAGLAFAKVRPGKTMGWQGYAAQPKIIPGRNTARDLAVLQDEWRSHLTVLAHAFADGDTSVQPKTYPTTCTFCTQRVLCRLDTATLLDTEDLDEPTEEEQA